jgi:hypothetical protein
VRQFGAGRYLVNQFSKLIEPNSFKLFSMKIIGKTPMARNGYAISIPGCSEFRTTAGKTPATSRRTSG